MMSNVKKEDKPTPPHPHIKGRKQVSNEWYFFSKVFAAGLSAVAATFVYQYNDGNFDYSGLLAIAGTLTMLFLIHGSESKYGLLLPVLIFVFAILWMSVEMVSIFGSYMSHSNSSELDQVRENKLEAKNKIAELRQDKINIENGSMNDNSKNYHKGLKDIAIENYESEAGLIIVSNDQKFFNDISKMIGIDNIEQLYRGLMAALFVLGAAIVVRYDSTLWCNWSLKRRIEQDDETVNILSRKPAQKKTTIKPAVTDEGTEETEPMEVSTFDRDFKAAKEWVNGHQDEQRVFVGKMKKACKGGSNWQHEAILNGLKKSKLLRKDDNGGTSPLYYKKSPKQAVLSQFAKTKNFLNIVKK